MSELQHVKHIGILLGDLPELNQEALKYFVLALNQRQTIFEFEFLPCPDDLALVDLLGNDARVDRDAARDMVQPFLNEYLELLKKERTKFGTQEGEPDHLILITTCIFTDSFYTLFGDRLGILALGKWRKRMAPPSIIEFLQVLILRSAAAAYSQSLEGSMHLGTKGCLFDFTSWLDDVRFKVLNGHVCGYCRSVLAEEGLEVVAEELKKVLDRSWIGKPDEAGTVAHIMRALGYDLFLTRGYKPSWWQNVLVTLQDEGVKTLLKVIGGVVVAALILLLGLK